MNELELGKFLSLCLHRIEEEGYVLEQVRDKKEAEARASRLRAKKRSAPFSLSLNDFTRSKIFWLFLRQGKRDVACAAARLDRFGEHELAEFWAETYARIYGEGHMELSKNAPSFLQRISGNVAYLGEFYFDANHRGNRNLMRSFTHALFVLCAQTLNTDWVYAFIPREHDSYGLGRVYGFLHFDEVALIWNNVPEGRRHETFCAISREELYERAGLFVEHPSAFLVPESDRFNFSPELLATGSLHRHKIVAPGGRR